VFIHLFTGFDYPYPHRTKNKPHRKAMGFVTNYADASSIVSAGASGAASGAASGVSSGAPSVGVSPSTFAFMFSSMMFYFI